MKIIVFLLSFSTVWSADRLGRTGGFIGPVSDSPEYSRAAAERFEREQLVKSLKASADSIPWRKHGGKIINISDVSVDWKWIVGTAHSINSEGVLLQIIKMRSDDSPEYVFLTGHPKQQGLVDGNHVAAIATRDGRYSYTAVSGAKVTVEKWTFGAVPTDQELEPILAKIAEDEKRQREEYEQARLGRVTATKARKAAQEQRVILWQHQLATNGSAYAQTELGFRYMEGRGVETNVALARHWLQAACTNGVKRACEALSRLR